MASPVRLVVIVALCMTAGFWVGRSVWSPAPPATLPPPATAAPVTRLPDFQLKDLSGAMRSIGEWSASQAVLINFWATWCGPCRKEMPLLEQIYKRYKGLGFTLLAVNVEEDSAGAEKWLKDTPVTFPVLFDRQNHVSQLYQVTAMPSTVIVDRKGQVRFVHYGYTPGTESQYQDQVRSLLREKS